jgi:hypothetical protein
MTRYDAISFFNELDLLELRLRELDHVIDRFVIVEAPVTHSGQPKPLHFLENQRRFAPWQDKIIHVVVGDMPKGDSLAATRRREMWQRNAILRGLIDAADDDIVLISDCDEIPRAERVPTSIPDGMIAVYLQKLYYFNFNTHAPDRPWPGTRACHVADARALSPHIIRNGMGQPDAHYPVYATMDHGGWHFSYFGDIPTKMKAFLHQELVSDEALDPATIARRVAEGIDIWGRENEQSFRIGPADDLPDSVLADLPAYTRFFAPGWEPEFHEDWYNGEQALFVANLARQAPQDGACVEIGAWEGRSTVVLAQRLAPRVLHVVDHWKGNPDEGDDHPATVAAAERDVFQDFDHNIDCLTAGNAVAQIIDWRSWIEYWPEYAKAFQDSSGIAFLHLDAAHDYASVRDCLLAIKPFLVNGAILCGDDAYADGVRLGVQEVFPDARVMEGRLWMYQYWRDER